MFFTSTLLFHFWMPVTAEEKPTTSIPSTLASIAGLNFGSALTPQMDGRGKGSGDVEVFNHWYTSPGASPDSSATGSCLLQGVMWLRQWGADFHLVASKSEFEAQ